VTRIIPSKKIPIPPRPDVFEQEVDRPVEVDRGTILVVTDHDPLVEADPHRRFEADANPLGRGADDADLVVPTHRRGDFGRLRLVDQVPQERVDHDLVEQPVEFQPPKELVAASHRRRLDRLRHVPAADGWQFHPLEVLVDLFIKMFWAAAAVHDHHRVEVDLHVAIEEIAVAHQRGRGACQFAEDEAHR
jgi:hypothetical protein